MNRMSNISHLTSGSKKNNRASVPMGALSSGTKLKPIKEQQD